MQPKFVGFSRFDLTPYPYSLSPKQHNLAWRHSGLYPREESGIASIVVSHRAAQTLVLAQKAMGTGRTLFHERRLGMAVRMQPRVLIICERAAERDTIRVLAGTMGCQWVLASSIEEALALLGRERTSAALLELPGRASNPRKLDQGVRELLVRFPGRIIVLTDESPSPLVGELISKYSIPSVQFDRLAVDLWPRLESMIYPQLGSGRITKVARLILDTFLQPLPAGIRYLTPDSRQLIYEASGLTADIAFERSPDSPRTTLTGQILRTNLPQVPLKGVPVVLKGQKGPLGLIRTNEAGEFTFEFQKERSVTLEIEVRPNDWVLLLSPPLDWFESGDDQTKTELRNGGSSAIHGNQANQLPRKKGKSA